MSAATELELESALTLASEGELELEHEQEAEHEAFFNTLAAMADRSGRSQALRRIALTAARAALRGRARPWPIIEGEAGELEAEAGELEALGELEVSPARLAHLFAEMEHEGHAAAEAANEQEAAEHFLPLIGLAAKFVLPKLAGAAARKLGGAALKRIGGRLLGRAGSQLLRRAAPRMLRRVSPQLTRGVANVTRTLFRNRATRPLIHAVPRIARSTVTRLATQAAKGRPVTPQLAARTLAQQTARTLSNPRVLAQTYRRSLALDRRYHQRTRRVLGTPAGAPVRAADDAAAAGAGAGGNGQAGVPYAAGPAMWPGNPYAAGPAGMAAMASMAGMTGGAAGPATCPACGR